MRAILAVLWNEAEAPAILAQAVAMARRDRGHVVGLFVRPSVETYIPGGDFGLALSQDYLNRIQREGRDRSVRLRSLFEAYVRDAGAALDRPEDGGFTAEWLDAEGSAPSLLGSIGRLYDLIVLARPDLSAGAEGEILMEAALFETGSPVLMVPPLPHPPASGRMVVAWNGSTETARAVHFGLPLLKRAQSVLVVSVSSGLVAGPSAAEVARYLVRHDIPAISRHVETDANAGEAFLAEAAKFDAELMIKGAFTQSRLRQLIFGGATLHILNHATLPILFAH